MTQFPFPPPPGSLCPPVWTGKAFQVDGKPTGVLAYDLGASGWTDDLTDFHEDVAGGTHYIDVASRRHALAELRRWVGQRPAVIMDVGCSSGFLLQEIRTALAGAEVIGADYVRGPLERLAKTIPDVPLLQFDLTQCPLPDSSLDAVVLLNVLEHIQDDSLAIRQVFRVLKPNGVAVIEVPAGPHLYDVYDKFLMHFRRYRADDLARLLRDAGFDILSQSHLGFFLYPAFAHVKRSNRKFLNESEESQKEIVQLNIERHKSNLLIRAVMRLEDSLRSHISYPCGIRCLFTCRKPAS
jgi:ubiquinone/menaquinone biosynthesis C-methylase UbiE